MDISSSLITPFLFFLLDFSIYVFQLHSKELERVKSVKPNFTKTLPFLGFLRSIGCQKPREREGRREKQWRQRKRRSREPLRVSGSRAERRIFQGGVKENSAQWREKNGRRLGPRKEFWGDQWRKWPLEVYVGD